MFLLIAALAGQLSTADAQVASAPGHCALTQREQAISQRTVRRRSRKEAEVALNAWAANGVEIPESEIPMRGCVVVSMQIGANGRVVGYDVVRSEGNIAGAAVRQFVQSQRYIPQGHPWKGLAKFVLKDAD